MRRARLHRPAVVLAALLFVGVWFAPAIASAHSVLINETPHGTVATAPSSVALDFNERPRARFSVIHVTGPDGQRRDVGALSVVDDRVTQPVGGSRPAGVYTVDWRVVSADGHPVSGQWRFTATAAAAALPVPAAAATTTTAARDDDGGNHLGHVALAVVVVLLIGASWVAERFWKRRTQP